MILQETFQWVEDWWDEKGFPRPIREDFSIPQIGDRITYITPAGR